MSLDIVIVSSMAVAMLNATSEARRIAPLASPASIQGTAISRRRPRGGITYRPVTLNSPFSPNSGPVRWTTTAPAGVSKQVVAKAFLTEAAEEDDDVTPECLFLSSDESLDKEDEEIGSEADSFEEEGFRVLYLEPSQMKKMVAASHLGAGCVNVETLAAEVGLDRSEVLAWLENSPSRTVLLNASEGSYMEDVHIVEEKEKPAVYVPPPPIPSREVSMRNKVETLMYTLKEIIISGPMAEIIADERRWNTIMKLFDETVELQNPLFCLRGRDGVLEWVQLLGQLGVVVKLLDIYYESTARSPYNRWVYAAWTATLTDDLMQSVVELGLTDWWATCYGPELVNFTGDGKQQALENPSKEMRVLQLSGEWRFEMDESGQVTNVRTRWYELAEEGGVEDLMDAKLWLSGILRRKLC